jgi:hypothetical protein
MEKLILTIMKECIIILFKGALMKKIVFLVCFSIVSLGLWAQQFTIPTGAVLLESTEFKNNGIPYMIERRYRLPSGEILYAYYDVEGQSSVTIQRIEQTPILALGTEINISGMPGYREFNFGDDRRKLVQFLKLMKLGWQGNYRGGIKAPSLSDHIFNGVPSWKSEFILLLDLFDETWVLEHREYSSGRLASNDTTSFSRVNSYSD